MKIGIIGAGKMGGNLARHWARAGHRTLINSLSEDDTDNLINRLGNRAKKCTLEELVRDSDVILLAIPWSSVNEVLNSVSFKNKIVIDCINPLTDDFKNSLIDSNSSSSEEILKLYPEIRIVKAFNMVASPTIENETISFSEENPTLFYCGNDEEAKKIVHQLAEDIGFDAVDAGDISNARYLESMAAFIIQLAFKGLGANIAFKLLK